MLVIRLATARWRTRISAVRYRSAKSANASTGSWERVLRPLADQRVVRPAPLPNRRLTKVGQRTKKALTHEDAFELVFVARGGGVALPAIVSTVAFPMSRRSGHSGV